MSRWDRTELRRNPQLREREERTPSRGETESTRIGKEIHRTRADERRERGDFDLVNSPITDRRGNLILVPKRFDLETGRALPESGLQEAVPDAVRFKDGLVVDDKPLGRPIAKDRQEILRFIEAYRLREGVLPKQIEIHRYDPATGEARGIETHTPRDFMENER